MTTAKEDSTAADAAPKGTTPGAAMDSVVHLVDEDPGARDRLDRLMRRAYLPCRGYRDSDDLLLRLNDDRPGCVLVTLRTPGMAGLRTQQRLRETGSTLSVVFLGDSPRVSAAVGAMRAGAEDFLANPTDDDTLIETVQQAVARDRRRKAQQGHRRGPVDLAENRGTAPRPYDAQDGRRLGGGSGETVSVRHGSGHAAG